MFTQLKTLRPAPRDVEREGARLDIVGSGVITSLEEEISESASRAVGVCSNVVIVRVDKTGLPVMLISGTVKNRVQEMTMQGHECIVG